MTHRTLYGKTVKGVLNECPTRATLLFSRFPTFLSFLGPYPSTLMNRQFIRRANITRRNLCLRAGQAEVPEVDVWQFVGLLGYPDSLRQDLALG